MNGKVIAFLLSILALPAGAQELLKPVPEGQAQRLAEYNSVFLQRELYFASRHRIVRADVNLLLRERNITVTPFEGVEPIRLIYESVKRSDDEHFFWKGRYDFQNDLLFQVTGQGIPADISAPAWDLAEDGTAVRSFQNRFEFSPEWKVDELGNVELGRDVIGATPPPRTPEEIERHRRLQALDKHAFYSVLAVFNVPGGSQYVLKPLQYTPRYSVIYEITPGTGIPIRIDLGPGETRGPSEIARFEEYRRFRDSLPNEEGKAVRGDVR